MTVHDRIRLTGQLRKGPASAGPFYFLWVAFPGMPEAIDSGVALTWIERVGRERRELVRDEVAIEEPLEIRVDGRALAVTMRTPGADEELAAGFLLGEGLIAGAADLANVGPNAELEANIVEVTTRAGLRRDPFDERRFHMTSSCGVCGKGALEQVRLEVPERAPAPVSVEVEGVLALPGRARAAQEAFDRTGGIHATALFTPAGDLVTLREDVGRHNAMDKAIGALLLGDGGCRRNGGLPERADRLRAGAEGGHGRPVGHRGRRRSHLAGRGAGAGARPAGMRVRPRRHVQRLLRRGPGGGRPGRVTPAVARLE